MFVRDGWSNPIPSGAVQSGMRPLPVPPFAIEITQPFAARLPKVSKLPERTFLAGTLICGGLLVGVSLPARHLELVIQTTAFRYCDLF